jgi:predicted acyl esterase
MKGQHMPGVFETLINPFEEAGTVERSEAEFKNIKIPVYTGAGWYGYTYKTHLQGAQTYWRHLEDIPKKLLFLSHAHLERPFHGLHHEIVRWYDHWLKGIDTGILDEPPVKYWVSGANEWRTGTDWPLPETEWTKLYLTSWERLRSQEFTPGSSDDLIPPDSFVQMPLTHTRSVAKLRFMTDPLPHDVLIAGPSSLKLWASIDQEDTNWMVILKDVGPDPSVRSAREGEFEVPTDLHERELTRGWLKASNRALDTERSTAWKPFHQLTREAAAPVVPGEVTEYNIEILATANLFRAGHRICVEIASMDRPTGVAGATDVEYVPYHLCSSRTTLHNIFHNPAYPSHVLLPVIPQVPAPSSSDA